MNYQQILENIYQEIQPFAGIGKQADYIPALASCSDSFLEEKMVSSITQDYLNTEIA